MLQERKSRLASLALAGALTVGFAAAASAQDWSGGARIDNGRMIHGGYRHPHYRAYGYGQPYAYDNGYYRDGYYGPLDLGGAIVGSALGVADTAAAAATGYPYNGYYGPGYGYDPYYNNGWWGPYHNQYQRYGYW